LDESDRSRLRHREASGGGDSADTSSKDVLPQASSRRARDTTRVAEQSEESRVLETELDLTTPPVAEFFHRIDVCRGSGGHGRGFVRDERRHDVLSNGLEQAVLVTEESVDRGGLDASGLRDASRRDSARALLTQEPGSDFDNAHPGVSRNGFVSHKINDTALLLSA
jgi:hypothetical protein